MKIAEQETRMHMSVNRMTNEQLYRRLVPLRLFTKRQEGQPGPHPVQGRLKHAGAGPAYFES